MASWYIEFRREWSEREREKVVQCNKMEVKPQTAGASVSRSQKDANLWKRKAMDKMKQEMLFFSFSFQYDRERERERGRFVNERIKKKRGKRRKSERNEQNEG